MEGPGIGLSSNSSPTLSANEKLYLDEKYHIPGQRNSFQCEDEATEIVSSKEERSKNVATNYDEIVYRYLDFDTELPNPLVSSLHQEQRDEIPPPPELKLLTNPFTWSPTHKTLILWICCLATSLTAYSAGSYSPAAQQMEDEWNVGRVAILVGITTFTVGFAIAPMVLAPFSEINGRKPVFIATGALFVVAQLCCGVTQSYAGLLVSRFFVGVGGSTFSTMVGGVVSDIYVATDRNTPMALFSGSALFGTGLGPMIGGFIAQNTTWRWAFYSQVIVDALLVGILAIAFRETRGGVVLSRKAKLLNKWYEKLERAGCPGQVLHLDSGRYATQRIRWKVAADEERASLATMIRVSISRPFHLLFTEPILFSFSLWVSFSWAVLYLTLAAIPLVFSEVYHFNVQAQGAVFASLAIASLLFTPVAIYQERFAHRHPFFQWPESPNAPEHRLLFACFESLLLPIGLFIFGWTCHPNISPAVPALGLGLATMGIFSIYLATFNYIADVYGQYASSGLAAQSFCRNITGGVLPLVTTAMFNHMGIGPASSLLGGIGILLGIVPWVLLYYGARVRGWSPFAVSGQGLT
jgi:multidrug resistance protein